MGSAKMRKIVISGALRGYGNCSLYGGREGRVGEASNAGDFARTASDDMRYHTSGARGVLKISYLAATARQVFGFAS